MPAARSPANQPAIFITGATAGIGAAVARLFVSKGWYVGLAARSADRLQTLAAELGADRCSWHVTDVADFNQLQSALQDFVRRSGGRLNVLVNNAGVLYAGDFETIPLDQQHAMLDINVKGVINGCQAAFEYLRATEGAHVINMSSASAMYGSPTLATYSASKFAVRALTEALNVEWARHDIAVTDIMPPFVDTDMIDSPVRSKVRAISLLGVQLTPEDVAQRVWQAVATRPLHDRVTTPFRVLALLQKHAPETVQRRVVKFLSGY